MDNKERLVEVIRDTLGNEGFAGMPVTYRKVADAIAEANLLAPQWISVKERLPDRGSFALVHLSDGVIRKDYRGITGWDTSPEYVVTHWQPIPNPPKA